MTVRDLLMSAAGASSGPVTYVEDVFSTYLYTGTGATQSINNGIDFTKGGMVWFKERSAIGFSNVLFDTVRGVGNFIFSNDTSGQLTNATTLTAFNLNGFSLGTDSNGWGTNYNGSTFASWTFRKQPKFFDVVAYTGTGSAHAISHSLGSTAGCIMVKRTDTNSSWAVYHKGANGGTTPQNYYTVLNTTAAQTSSSAWWNNTAPTSSQFTVGTDATVNASGGTYIAYIFADQAGGFGATGTGSAIACGSYTGSGAAGNFVSLGWEPQYVMVKETDTTGNWVVEDVMRGMAQKISNELFPNLTNAETALNPSIVPAATGFYLNTTNAALNTSAGTYIYIAIRRPNKPPTVGTDVFIPVFGSDYSPMTTGFPVDLTVDSYVSGDSKNGGFLNRLVGASVYLSSSNTSAETTALNSNTKNMFQSNTSVTPYFNGSNTITWNFRRAPTFFDEVCYKGTGSATTQNHNLTVAPEMMIVKERSAINNWWIYHSATGNTNYSVLNTTAIPVTSSTAWNNTTPTASVFSIGTGTPVNTSGATYVAYLFATCAGVSKVGTYTGNATGQSIACGFGSGGARFILIKRTDSTGDWYCFDSANGLTSSSSPYLTWDTTNAQTTGNNGVYASSGGFTLGATASLTTNIATATYIFLAIS